MHFEQGWCVRMTSLKKTAQVLITLQFVLITTGCPKFLGKEQSEGDRSSSTNPQNSEPSPSPSPSPSPTPFTKTWPFDALSDSSYVKSNSVSIELTGGVAKLTASNQKDDTGTLFSNGSFSGNAQFDSSNSTLRLGSSGTSNLEMDSSWTPAWSNIVGLWKMNGTVGNIANTDTIPATTGPNATASNANSAGLAYVTGLFNQGVNLDGTDDYLSIPHSTALDVTTAWSISAWVNLSAHASATAILTPQFQPGDTLSFMLGWDGGNISAGVFSSSWYKATASSDLTMGSWQHVMGTYSGAAQTVSLYINGILIAQNTSAPTSIPSNTKQKFIGRRWDNDHFVTGKIDEVTLWNTALSSTDVSTIYQHQISKYTGTFTSRVMDAFSTNQIWQTLTWSPTLPFQKGLPGNGSSESQSDYPSLSSSTLMSGIVGLWHLDGTLGNIANNATTTDSSGNGYTGTITNVISANDVSYVSGELNQGIQYQNQGGYVNFGTVSGVNFNTSDFTVSLWLKTTSNNGYMQLLNNRNSICSHGSFWALYMANGTILAEIDQDSGGTNYTYNQTTATYNDDKWHQVLLKRVGTTLTTFVDGVSRASSNSAGVTSISNSSPMTLGYRNCAGSSRTFVGSFDEVAIWSRGLSNSEIIQLYRRGANRIRAQVRSCSDSTCSTGSPDWLGPDGTAKTYFSELYNTALNSSTGAVQTGIPLMTFSNFGSLAVPANRYFQYRAILESDDANSLCDYGSGATPCSPELASVTVGPTHYDNSAPTLSSATGVSYRDLTQLAETLGSSNGCTSGTKYNLSRDGTNWYYWTGAVWAISNGTYAEATSAATLTSSVLSFFASQVGTGSLYFKTFLKSDGTQACEIDSLTINGNQ